MFYNLSKCSLFYLNTCILRKGEYTYLFIFSVSPAEWIRQKGTMIKDPCFTFITVMRFITGCVILKDLNATTTIYNRTSLSSPMF